MPAGPRRQHLDDRRRESPHAPFGAPATYGAASRTFRASEGALIERRSFDYARGAAEGKRDGRAAGGLENDYRPSAAAAPAALLELGPAVAETTTC
ncbi:MAG TPA: hypothetical protein VFS57_03030, partial [Gemmatimonadaceae bacterium]|nr:hypothetical protein [Gemmatimonadaceae bacterium]